MATIAVTAQGLDDHLGVEFDVRATSVDAATLTTDHTCSSRGLPVLVRDGMAYGPGDLPGIVLHWSATMSEDAAAMPAAARAAGWTVKIVAYCDWCANDLSEPETRHPGDMHPDCAETATRIRAEMAAPGYVPIPLDEYRAH